MTVGREGHVGANCPVLTGPSPNRASALTRVRMPRTLSAVTEMIPQPNNAYWTVVATAEPPELGQGPRAGVRYQQLLEEQLNLCFANSGVTCADAIVRLRAAALLFHDHHDAAHDLVQDLTDHDGALLHGILHRREPDYWNAKYWFRRFVAHPAHVALGKCIPSLVTDPVHAALAKEIIRPGAFDPFAFVDLVEAAARKPANDSEVLWLRRVQHAEFEAIVAHLLA